MEGRPGPHETHLTLQHVPQLWQLVDARPAEPSPDPRHAGVVPDLEQWLAGLVAIAEGLDHRVGALHHGAELEEGERAAPPPQTGLPVEHRTARRDPDGERDHA